MNLVQMISQYEPDERAAELVRSTKVVLLVGISGAGKDTIKRQILKNDDFCDIISHATRLPRVNNGVPETPDVDYHFVDMREAQSMLKNHEFIEAKYVHGTVYGTSIGALEKVHSAGKIAITDVDVQGVVEYKDLSPNVTAIFILPPDFDTWRERFAERYVSSPERLEVDWDKRRHSAVSELTHALKTAYFHFVVNDDLTRAVQTIEEIARRSANTRHEHDAAARDKARKLLEDVKASLAL